uniref:Uncharacterized protein n=1 Tax=Anguilla anguilla TaxID=7936 RepID=A0A0E9PM83_ANGAN
MTSTLKTLVLKQAETQRECKGIAVTDHDYDEAIIRER